MACFPKTTRLPAMSAASPPTRTTSARFWDATAVLSGMWSFVLAPTSSFLPSFDDCAPSLSIALAVSPIKSIYLWGSYFEKRHEPMRMDALLSASGGGQHAGTTASAESTCAANQEWPPRSRRFASSRLADSRGSAGRSTATESLRDSATGAEEQGLPSVTSGNSGGRKGRVPEPRSVFSQRVFAVRGQTLRSWALRE